MNGPLLEKRGAIAEFSFNGGIRLTGHKKESTQQPIASLPLPEKFVIPLRQHLGGEIKPLVSLGDKVLKGQLIGDSKTTMGASVHAPTSGTVTAIEKRAVPHASGLDDLCIEVSSDAQDRWIDLSPLGEEYRRVSPQTLTEKLDRSGIVGLGGAVFPTYRKMQTGREHQIETLIVNGAECEPWISCDQALMQERASEIVKGIEITLFISGASNCLIGIEDNKPEAIKAMEIGINQSGLPAKVITIPTIYPTGGERQLIKVLTDKEVPAEGYPSDIGMLVLNVATVWSLYRFIIEGKPLISRIVTVTGDGVEKPQNIETLIGSPFSELIGFAGGYKAGAVLLTMGGPMMGFTVPHDNMPVVKATNCLLVQTSESISVKPTPVSCIRCAACAEVCPVELLPQQLFWYSRAKKFDTLERFNINSCIECGCCDYVCPSHIPLAHYFKFAKTEIRALAAEKEKADIARMRHEARAERLERIKKEKAEKLAAKKAALQTRKKNQGEGKKAAITDALERAQKRKQSIKINAEKVNSGSPDIQTKTNSENSSLDRQGAKSTRDQGGIE